MPQPTSQSLAATLDSGKFSQIRDALDPKTPQGRQNLRGLSTSMLSALRVRLLAAPASNWLRRIETVWVGPHRWPAIWLLTLIFLFNPSLILFAVGFAFLAWAWWDDSGKPLRELSLWTQPLSDVPSLWQSAAASVLDNPQCADYHTQVRSRRELLVGDAFALDSLLTALVGTTAPSDDTARSVLWPAKNTSAHSREALVSISEAGEGQERECPVCGATPGQPCTGEDPADPGSGVEYGRKVHRARLAED